jgi:hypothetical protein
MPHEGFEQLLDGCRYRSTLICLNPRKSDDMTVPIGGSPPPLSSCRR